MYAVEGVAEVERAGAKRIARVATLNGKRQLRFFPAHIRCGDPARVRALVGYLEHTLPFLFQYRRADEVAQGLTRPNDVVETPVCE